MGQAGKPLLTSLIACILFGYAAINCLLFYRRTRARVGHYKNPALDRFVNSRQYNWTIWIAGGVGAIGFLISSWRLVLSLMQILRGSS